VAPSHIKPNMLTNQSTFSPIAAPWLMSAAPSPLRTDNNDRA
jgi:hypothetical protein